MLINFLMYFFWWPSSTSSMVANMSPRYLKPFPRYLNHFHSMSPKKIDINDVSHDKKNIDQLLDVLLLVAVVDVLHGGRHVPDVLHGGQHVPDAP